MNAPAAERSDAPIWMFAGGWAIASIFVGEAELLAAVPAPAIPLILIAITVAALAACWRSNSLRSRLAALDLRCLILVHVTRVAAIHVWVLHSRGVLPNRAVPFGGRGEIALAMTALVLCTVPTGARLHRWAVLLWNTAGLLDLLLLCGIVGRLSLVAPISLQPLARLPWSFLPMLLVPLLIASHVIIFFRLCAERRLLVLPQT